MAERGLQGGQGLVLVAGLEDVGDGGPGVQGAVAGCLGIRLGPVITFALGQLAAIEPGRFPAGT